MSEENQRGQEDLLASLRERYPAGVPRCRIEEATGGLVSSKALANHDSLGTGPTGAFKVRGKVVYPSISLVQWLFNGGN